MAPRSISATELACAVLDTNWRKLWLAGEKPSTRKFAPAGTPRALGSLFHKQAEALIDWLTARDRLAEAMAIESGAGLLDHLWTAGLEQWTDEALSAGRGEEAVRFVARLRAFCQRLADLRGQSKAFQSWQDLFVGAELPLAGLAVPVGAMSVEVRARVDAIRIHPERGLEVVDYKLSQGARQKDDMVQLAIYARLLSLWRPGCAFDGALEYYLPEFSEVAVSRADLDEIFEAMVAPTLIEMCAPSAKPAAPTATAKDATGTLARRTVDAFRDFKLAVEVAGIVEGPQLTRLRLTPGVGVKVASLANRAEDLQIALSLASPPIIHAGKGYVFIDLPRLEATTCFLKDAVAAAAVAEAPGAARFPIGIGVDGDILWADLADPSSCHLLVAGSTGSGKSEWLKSLVAAIALRADPDAAKFALVDPKILTFAGVDQSPFLWRPVVTTLEDATAVLREAVDEMESRYQELAREGFANLGERRKSGKVDLPFLVLVFDEFADLILAGGEEKKQFETLVAKIAGKGRAAGVHLVLATQRPDRTIVTGLIKANLPLKVCLKVANAVNARIVLDETGAENLFGRGDLLYDQGKGIVRAQGLFVSHADFLAALRASP